MLRNSRIGWVSSALVGVGVLALACACGSDSGGTEEADAGNDQGGEDDKKCVDCASPPAPAENAVQGDGDGVVLAISKLNLVDKGDDWKRVGYDLDGYKSNLNSAFHCKLAEGASTSVKADGERGIDNSFGANIMPSVVGMVSDVSEKAQDSLDDGSFSILIAIDGLGTGANYVDLPAALYAGAALGNAPKWDGTDEWPVFCELMQDCKETGTAQFPTAKSRIQFPKSYVTGNTWVSGEKRTISISMVLQGYALALDINQAVFTVNLSGSPVTGGSGGILAGVLEATKVVEAVVNLGGNLYSDLCDQNAPMSKQIQSAILNAADIMKDGTQDPDKSCDGISIGLGFDMKRVQLGQVNDKNPEASSPCDP
ncbi:MAG: hypothetical protein FWD57_08390 [Polyangiaceae bacterium]|nr:hypothetical protein [Polyangiaceae bacterium]